MSPIRHPLDGSFAASSWAAVMSADVACGQAKAEQSPLAVSDTVDFCRSAATGAADRLLSRSAFSTGG
jgi:hypothetical protein